MTVKVLTLTITIMLYITLSFGQRPSYAGSRPPNGHKDKYRPIQNTTNTELTNRFGGDSLANGVSQRPPQGVPVVTAEQEFIPIKNNQAQESDVPQLSNRFSSVGNENEIAVNRIPLDAHGDQQLIDHLNQIPIDNRPFWFINYQAIEAQRNNSVSNSAAIATRGSFFGK